MKRRNIFVFTLLLVVIFVLPMLSAYAYGSIDNWPERMINVIVPYNPGGDTDTTVRSLIGPLSDALGVKVVLTTMTGAAGTVATDYVRLANPDGYTVLWHHNGINTTYIYGQYEYNYSALESANILAYSDAYYLVSNPAKWTSLEDFVKYARENPGKGIIGAPTGAFSYLVFLSFMDELDLDLNLVDITGAAEGAIELLGGRMDVTDGVAATYGDYLPSGQLKPIMTYAAKRSEMYPDCPTAEELGYGKLKAFMQFGFHFPPGTDEAIIDKFNEACKVATQSDSFLGTCKKFDVDPVFWTKKEAAAKWEEMLNYFMIKKEALNN